MNSSDSALTTTAAISGKGYSGPREIMVPAKGSGMYPLTFSPPGSGTFTGTLELIIAATGEHNVYNLIGKAAEPLAEGHIAVECQVGKRQRHLLLCCSLCRAIQSISGFNSFLSRH